MPWLRQTALALSVIVMAGTLAITPSLSVEDLRATYAPPPSRFMAIDGMDVHYRDEGTGQTIVLIHGTSSSLHTWDAWTDALKGQYRVIRMDIPAFGLTGPHPANDHSIAAYVRLVHALTERLGVDRFAIAGNSLGGEIAWHYALTHRERVSGLLLIDAAGYPRPAHEFPWIFKLGRTPVAADLMPLYAPRLMYVQNVNEVYHDRSRITDALVDRYRNLMLREGNREAMVDRINEPFVDRSPELKTLDVPTLVMWGRHDRWIPLRYGERFVADMPDATLAVYDAGHVPMEELPSQTVADARAFLARLAP